MGPEEFKEFLNLGWRRYCEMTPDATRIVELLEGAGESIQIDHIAFRTFDLPGISRIELGSYFERFGFERQADMIFVEKKLRATSWLHPDLKLPKIFISELLLEQVSPELREWIHALTRKVRAEKIPISSETFLKRGWPLPNLSDYRRFYNESEYAVWTATFGIQINHFTLLVNALQRFQELADLNAFLEKSGLTLNLAGGAIKGSSLDGLEQSSTMAQPVPWEFAEGETAEIMSCYFEFAKRYAVGPSSELYQGFISKSANKIFESTKLIS